MKIGVDAGCLGIKDGRLKVGVYTVVKNLLIELGKIDKKNEYLLYSFYPIEKSLLKEFGSNMRNIVVQPAMGWLKIALPMRLFMDKVSMFIGANQALPMQTSLTHYKTIGIAYDVAFEKFPEFYSYASDVTKIQRKTRYFAQHADKIIVISNRTKKDLISFYTTSEKKVIVAYPGIEKVRQKDSGQARMTKNKNPYFLFVGAFKKSKNMPRILNAFAQFLKTSDKKYQLLLVGGDKWLDPEIKTVLEGLPASVRPYVKQLGFVSDAKLSSLYKGAEALVSPSLYEGFGLPLLEAMMQGCPVIAGNTGSQPEVVGNAGILVNPEKAEEIVKAMQSIVKNKKKYSDLGRKRAMQFKPSDIAKAVYNSFYEV